LFGIAVVGPFCLGREEIDLFRSMAVLTLFMTAVEKERQEEEEEETTDCADNCTNYHAGTNG